MRKLVLSWILFFTLFSNTYAAHPVIIDTDVGTDDAVAMLYLLNRSDIEVKAITIASTGEAHCENGFRNVTGLLQLAEQPNVPVACGRIQPLKGHHQFPDTIRASADSLSGAANLLPQAKVKQSSTAMNLLVKTLKKSSGPVDILEIGPLTNIGELLSKHPELKSKIRMLYVMGGAVAVSGNLIQTDPSINNAVAEWNLYVDPTAADIVFRSGIPITLVSLDVTNQVPVEIEFYHQVKQAQQGKMTQFLYELFHKDEIEILNHQWYFWDALAAVITSDESIVNVSDKKLRIVLTPETHSGATVIDEKTGNTIRVCTEIKDKKKFEKLLLNTIKANDK